MATQTQSESPFVRFLDNFLQEKNIKWVLTAGMLILLGSSLMIVMPNWDTFIPTWKFLTIVGYSALIFSAGWWSYHKLALRKTGTGLLALSVLIMPVCCVAWTWLSASSDSASQWVGSLLLLGFMAVIVVGIARYTFRHFLRGDQPTFLTSYLILCFAGCFAPAIREAHAIWSWFATICLWGVFTVGAVKVNRHVFWLAEEHRQPRILGFFPILLLGGQFLAIFALNFARHFSADWMGFGCVLVAIPVLLTADTVARVFQERTGNLVRPFPWSIMLPFTAGVMLCVGGIGLTLAMATSRVPYAVVPAALLTAIMMALIARRTGHQAFVWGMLVAIVVAYNFSPVFFQGLARTVVRQGAVAVRESRLPFAFYGLTYLPLIALIAGAATFLVRSAGSRKGWAAFESQSAFERVKPGDRQPLNELFAVPMQRFCVGLSLLLLLVSFTHEKALLPVAVLMTFCFAGLAIAFQDRRLALFGIGSFAIASLGTATFVEKALQISLAPSMYFMIPLSAATFLTATSSLLDRLIRRVPMPDRVPTDSNSVRIVEPHPVVTELWDSLCRMYSLLLTCGIAVVWAVMVITTQVEYSIYLSLGILTLLFAHSLIWVRPSLSGATYLFGMFAVARWTIAAGLSLRAASNLFILIFLSQWVLVYVLRYLSHQRVSRAWGSVNQLTSSLGLTLAATCVALPSVIWVTMEWATVTPTTLACYTLLAAWCFDVTGRQKNFRELIGGSLKNEDADIAANFSNSAICELGSLLVLGTVSSLVISTAGVQWVPLASALTACVGLVVVEFLRAKLERMSQQTVLVDDIRALQALRRPIEITAFTVTGITFALHLLNFAIPTLLAGYAAVVGVVLIAIRRKDLVLRVVAVAAVNWTVMLAIVQCFVQGERQLNDLFQSAFYPAPWILAALSALSVLVWRIKFVDSPRVIRELGTAQRFGLWIFAGVSLVATLMSPTLAGVSGLLAALAFAALIASELRAACQERNESFVWIAELILLAALGYFVWYGWITFGRGLSMFICLASGVAFFVLGTLASRAPNTAILSKPFLTTGLWLPLGTVAIGVFRHFSGFPVVWHGLNSLVVLAAGAFYFWQAIDRRSKSFAVLSAVIMNIALSLLWHELEFSDPQFYMIPLGISILVLVEILKRDLPSVWHNPIRYAGALTILVSPTFHIINGSWLHMFTLMITSTLVLLVSMGLRVRALMYAGTAFLIADLLGMVISGSIDHPNLLWIAGIGFGGGVVALGAFCEHHREKLLQQMRLLSMQLQKWE